MTEEQEQPFTGRFHLRLIIAGASRRSGQAIENLHRICAEQLQGRVELEIIDVYQQPELAEKYQVIAAPTLVRLLPLPVRRIIGDLSQEAQVLRGLEIKAFGDEGTEDAPPGQ
jgi:circadian clock protein KaiB